MASPLNPQIPTPWADCVVYAFLEGDSPAVTDLHACSRVYAMCLALCALPAQCLQATAGCAVLFWLHQLAHHTVLVVAQGVLKGSALCIGNQCCTFVMCTCSAVRVAVVQWCFVLLLASGSTCSHCGCGAVRVAVVHWCFVLLLASGSTCSHCGCGRIFADICRRLAPLAGNSSCRTLLCRD
jgi:hypothetical protein